MLEQMLTNGYIGGRRAKRRRPKRLTGGRGYDSNPLRDLLARRDIEPIIPARRNNRLATHQDRRKMRRY